MEYTSIDLTEHFSRDEIKEIAEKFYVMRMTDIILEVFREELNKK